MTDKIYYEDQTHWSDADFYALWRYFDRLAEYVGPTPAQLQQPEHRSARISARKHTVRDEELASIDPGQMPAESQWLLRAVLVSQQRYELALEKFPNLGALARAVPSAAPRGYAQYPASVRVALDPVEARRESMADIVASWDLEGARPDEQGMQIVRDYVDGKTSLDEALAAVARRAERFREEENS
ncbi:antitoxin VbhA family protein [Microbacterium keratanolyticum]